MRRLAIATAALALGALTAASALALTVSPTPTQQEAARLKLQQQRGSANGSTELRDTFAGSGRPGDDFYGSQGDYRRTQTFSFGNVTTTVTTGRDNSLPSFLDQDPRRATRFGNEPLNPDLIGRRR